MWENRWHPISNKHLFICEGTTGFDRHHPYVVCTSVCQRLLSTKCHFHLWWWPSCGTMPLKPLALDYTVGRTDDPICCCLPQTCNTLHQPYSSCMSVCNMPCKSVGPPYRAHATTDQTNFSTLPDMARHTKQCNDDQTVWSSPPTTDPDTNTSICFL